MSSLLVRPDAAKTISGIAVYCSYDYNKGIAYFDNLSLKAVAGESYIYNDQNAVTRVDTPFGSTVNSYDSNGYRLSNQSVNGRGQSVTYSGNRVTQTTRLNCNNGSLRTNYTYDAYGNVKETKLSSPSLSRGITEKYVYSNGRFVTASYDSRRPCRILCLRQRQKPVVCPLAQRTAHALSVRRLRPHFAGLCR